MHSSVVFSELLNRVAEGDSLAENQLYQQFCRKLIALAAVKISTAFRSKVDAEDIVQSVYRSFFIRFRADRVQVESWESLWSFLACVTIRKCSEKSRRLMAEKRGGGTVTSLSEAIENGAIASNSSPEPSPEELLVLEETIAELLEPFSESQADIIRLRMEGFTFAEIGEKIGRTERTVYRSMNELRDRMAAMLNGDLDCGAGRRSDES